ncbi:MAG: hypothetical protein IPG83_07140 [Novosphingobium sp.]|nr:hypothetical protein [Novosphingobium sp.]
MRRAHLGHLGFDAGKDVGLVVAEVHGPARCGRIVHEREVEADIIAILHRAAFLHPEAALFVGHVRRIEGGNEFHISSPLPAAPTSARHARADGRRAAER